jgi:hypothetical protein
MYSQHVSIQQCHYQVPKQYTKTNFPYNVLLKNALLKIQCIPVMSKMYTNQNCLPVIYSYIKYKHGKNKINLCIQLLNLKNKLKEDIFFQSVSVFVSVTLYAAETVFSSKMHPSSWFDVVQYAERCRFCGTFFHLLKTLLECASVPLFLSFTKVILGWL